MVAAFPNCLRAAEGSAGGRQCTQPLCLAHTLTKPSVSLVSSSHAFGKVILINLV